MRRRRVFAALAAVALVAASALSFSSPAHAVDVEFLPSTADQSPGAITVGITGTLLVGVSLDNAPAGTTFRFGSTTGLAPAFGYVFTSTLTEISFTGAQADVNAALASMLISTGSAGGSFSINVTAVPNAANVYYDAPEDHYYKYVAGPTTSWTSARVGAGTQTLNGATGYLVNITTAQENNYIKLNVNASNIWIGGSDASVSNTWQWMDGPEAGTTFWIGTASGTTVAPFNYAAWAAGEPNNSGGTESYAVTNWRGTLGAWNDVANNSIYINGYLVEFSPPVGGWTGASSTTLTAAVNGVDPEPSPEAAENVEPAPWLQAYGRQQDGICLPGWHPSWAEWAVDKTGGWTCERTVLWNGSTWVQNPNAVWGTYDASLNSPWSTD